MSMFGKYSRTVLCEQNRQIGNALKASEKFWRNHCMVYQYKMTMNEKVTMIDLIVEYYHVKSLTEKKIDNLVTIS